MFRKFRLSLTVLWSLALVATGCTTASRVAQHKQVVRRAHEQVWSKGNLALVEELYAPDFVCHFVIGPEWRGHSGVEEQVRELRAAFPDWNERVVRLVAEDDFVVSHFVSTGTNDGEFHGDPPTGRRVRIDEVAICRMQDGKIAEQWGMPDVLGMERQLRGKAEGQWPGPR